MDANRPGFPRSRKWRLVATILKAHSIDFCAKPLEPFDQ
jgi:hypothetical protein